MSDHLVYSNIYQSRELQKIGFLTLLAAASSQINQFKNITELMRLWQNRDRPEAK